MGVLSGGNGEHDESAPPAPRDFFERMLCEYCPTLWDVLACAPGRRAIALNELRHFYAAANAQVLGLIAPWEKDDE